MLEMQAILVDARVVSRQAPSVALSRSHCWAGNII
jgi:hypothetical protein